MKNKFLNKLLVFSMSALMALSLAKAVKAFTPSVAIEDLPEYTRTDTFKISYSALVDGSVNAQF